MSHPFGFVVSVDFETWNIDDIRIGIYNYLRNLRVLMMAYHVGGDPAPPQLWRPGMPFPTAIRDALAAGAKLAGWNSVQFERLVWRDRAVPDHGFPPVPDDVWLDSMHLAAAANLPRSLDGCARAVGVAHDADLKDSNRIRRITDANRTPIPATVHSFSDLSIYPNPNSQTFPSHRTQLSG